MELDYERAGFQWISSLDADHSIVSFVRRSLSDGQTLFIICNFTPVVYKIIRQQFLFLASTRKF